MVTRLAIIIVATTNWSTSLAADDAAWEARASDTVLVTVNERPITKGDLEFELLWRRVPPERQPAARRRFVEELVERELLRGFLEQRKVAVPQELIDRQLEQLRQLTTAADRDFDDVIGRLGFTEESLRVHLELPLAWRIHLNRVVTERQFREFFDERRQQFDGTRVRASQIVISVPNDGGEEEWTAAEQVLARVRREIAAGEVEFAEAVRRHSDSPSRDNGGDLGFFTFNGQLPVSVATAAFKLKPGELSRPVRSPFGVHLLMVTDRIAGALSLEDVRGQVFHEVSRRMWDEEVERLRADASIEWRVEPAMLEGSEP